MKGNKKEMNEEMRSLQQRDRDGGKREGRRKDKWMMGKQRTGEIYIPVISTLRAGGNEKRKRKRREWKQS